MPERELREMILHEATRLFATRGFAGTAMRDVAEACRCTKPALYYHFEHKEALFRAVVERHFSRIEALVTRAVQGPGSVRECLHGGVDELIDYCIEAPYVMRLLQRLEISPEDNAPCTRPCAAREAHLGMLAGLIQRGIDAKELRADVDALDAALVVAGATHFQLERSMKNGDWDRIRIHRTLDLVLDGIAL